MDMSLAHGGGDGRRDGDGSGAADAPGAGDCTSYETDTATARAVDGAVTDEVGVAQVLDVMLEAMMEESVRRGEGV